MSLTWRFVADLAERVVWTFLQAYFGFWLATGAGWDTLFTLDGLKVALTAAALVVATTVVRKPIGNPDSASVLPPAAQPPAPQPPEVPAVNDVPASRPRPVAVPLAAPLASVAVMPAGTFEAAIYSQRLQRWSTVYLHEETADEGTFVVTTAKREGLPVAEYRPDSSGTHTPLGPMEMSLLGLRPAMPAVPEAP